MKTLRLNKHDVLYFHLHRYHDKANANTYYMFGNSFIVRKGERLHLSDLDIKGWKPYHLTYSYADAYDIVKAWLNDNTNMDIRYMSDYPNIIVSESYHDKKYIERLRRN